MPNDFSISKVQFNLIYSCKDILKLINCILLCVARFGGKCAQSGCLSANPSHPLCRRFVGVCIIAPMSVLAQGDGGAPCALNTPLLVKVRNCGWQVG